MTAATAGASIFVASMTMTGPRCDTGTWFNPAASVDVFHLKLWHDQDTTTLFAAIPPVSNFERSSEPIKSRRGNSASVGFYVLDHVCLPSSTRLPVHNRLERRTLSESVTDVETPS